MWFLTTIYIFNNILWNNKYSRQTVSEEDNVWAILPPAIPIYTTVSVLNTKYLLQEAGVSLTWQMCENKAGEENILEMVGRFEYILQLSGLSALVKINSLKL